MAAKSKYAGLVDVDSAAPEIYETPELTDDASTVQTGTLRTDSPTPSDDDGDERLDRQRIDRDYARRRFEPSLVNAKDVDFSDTIGDRQSYRTGSRRRRRRRRHDDDSDGSESDEETLNSKIARLKREAEEVRIQLARREEGEFKDSVEEQDQPEGDTDGMEELDQLIRGLHPSSKGTAGKSEEAFLQNLVNGQSSTTTSKQRSTSKEPSTTASTTSAIAAFSDRLTALETVLGLTTIDPSTATSSILPTINTLTTQITTLTSALSPTTKSSSTTTTPSQTLNLDTLSTRIATLTKDADALTTSRKAALQSLSDLHESRLRLASTRTTRADTPARTTAIQSASNEEDRIHTELFLSEQSSKISALYQVLPTITGLQPLLPVVLERLRSLSVIHAGAAEARGQLDEVIKRQGEMKRGVQRWREAVEGVERQMEEMREGMKENVDVVGRMVRGAEERVKALGKR